MKGASNPHASYRTPPMTGPKINPVPMPPITIPTHCARLFSGIMSATIPIAAGKSPAVNPPSKARTAMNTPSEGANRNPIFATTKAASATRTIGRRPILSAREPTNGAARNAASANDMVISPRDSTPAPNSPSRLAKIGRIMPKPVIIRATLPASSRRTLRARVGLGNEVATSVAVTTLPRFLCDLSVLIPRLPIPP